MPAEWEPHAATWLSWPRRAGISFPGAYEEAMPAFRRIVEALHRSEPVCINVCDTAHEKDVRATLDGVDLANVRFFYIPTNEPWCRDHGPMFIKRDEDGQRAVVDWDYNAWGGKYPPYDRDQLVPARIGQSLGLPVFSPGFVMEGGSIDVNGSGSILTTTSCLLNPNRNPTRSKAEIEQALSDHLGVRQFLWLGEGIEGDDTDGHIDDITRFVAPNVVMTAVEPDRADPNHEPLRENLEALRNYRTEDGSPLEIVEVPMPPRLERDSMRLPASHLNFYIANRVILMPAFGDESDAVAARLLERHFPDRKVMPIDCRELVWGLGAVHCLTQQQPD
ncbi:MAG: agmatine deiminase family protein [Verrucomicrobia bacterium]|nr:agmatine deiminase family protein [Verrucomicrobiota bacterium]